MRPAPSASGEYALRERSFVLPANTPRSFIELLATHPYFEIHALGASSRSAGKEYASVTKWKLASRIPEKVRSMIVQECVPEPFKECGVVFSGLDHDVAGDIGECWSLGGFGRRAGARQWWTGGDGVARRTRWWFRICDGECLCRTQ